MYIIKYKNQIPNLKLKLGDLVQINGVTSEGDSSPLFGKVQAASFTSSNELVTSLNGLKVEIYPNAQGTVINKEYVDNVSVSVLEKSLGVNARVWPKDRDLQVGDVIPSAQETADGLPITHVIVDGNAYAMSPAASGLVSDLTSTSATIGGVSVYLLQSQKRFNNLSQALSSGLFEAFEVESYHPVSVVSLFDSYLGGGKFTFSTNTPKALHDGGRIIDPLRVFPSTWDSGKEAAVEQWLFGAGNAGFGCYIRCDDAVSVAQYGAKGNFNGSNGCDDTNSFNAATGSYEVYNGVNFSNISALKRTVIVDDTKSAYLIEGACYVRKGQHLRGNGLGPARIFVKSPIAKERAYDAFRLGVGLISNPFPSNPVQAAISGTNVIQLQGDIRNGQFNWLTRAHTFKVGGKWFTVRNVEFTGGNTVITVFETLEQTINAGTLVEKSELSDSGGLPPSISNICTEGGHNDGYVVSGRFAAGMTLNTLFITTAQFGIDGSAGDVNLHTVTADNGGVGLRLSGSRNSVLGCHFFWNNIGIQASGILSKAYDWVISSCTFAFNKFQDIAVDLGADGRMKKVSLSNCNFLENAQEATKTGMIHFISGDAEMSLNGCNFSNMRNWAVVQSSGFLKLRINGGEVDGLKSNDAYVQSTTSKFASLINGSFKIRQVALQNISEDMIVFNSTNVDSSLIVEAVSVENCNDAKPLVKLNATAYKKLSIRGNTRINGNSPLVDGVVGINDAYDTEIDDDGSFTTYQTSGGRNVAKVKMILGRTKRVRVTSNPEPTGSAYYVRAEEYNINSGTATIGGSVKDALALNMLSSSIGGTFPPELDVNIGFDVTGLKERGFSTNRLIDLFVSVPDVYGRFDVSLN